MSDICSLLPPFGDPWPSCLLRSQSAGVSWGLVSPVTACLPSLVDTALRLWEVGGSRPAARPLQRVSWALPMQPQSLWLPNALQAETPVSRQTGWVVLGHPACLPSSSWIPAPTHLQGHSAGQMETPGNKVRSERPRPCGSGPWPASRLVNCALGVAP